MPRTSISRRPDRTAARAAKAKREPLRETPTKPVKAKRAAAPKVVKTPVKRVPKTPAVGGWEKVREKVREKKEGVSHPFYILRALVVAALAKQGVPTTRIADILSVNRSYVIKQQSVPLKPRNAPERALLRVAQQHEAFIRRHGFGGLLKGEDIVTVLAGDQPGRAAKPGAKRGGRPKGSKNKPRAQSARGSIDDERQSDIEDKLPQRARGTTPRKHGGSRRAKAGPPVPVIDPDDSIDQMMGDLGVPGYESVATPAPDSILRSES